MSDLDKLMAAINTDMRYLMTRIDPLQHIFGMWGWHEWLVKHPRDYYEFVDRMWASNIDIEATIDQFLAKSQSGNGITGAEKVAPEPESRLRIADAGQVVISILLHPANDPQYRIAAGANFSTKEQFADRPTWVGESQFGDEVVKVLAAPADPIGRRVKITIWIDNSKTISAGECLFISFTETDGSQAPESVELKAIDARIQGSASIAMTWTDFLIKANSPLHITRHPATN